MIEGYVGTSGAFQFTFYTNNVARGNAASDGGLVWGSPTGGSKGPGTINATALYVNGVAVTAP